LNKWEKLNNNHRGFGSLQKMPDFNLVTLAYDIFERMWSFFTPTIRIKRMNPKAIVPTRGTEDSAGLDLYAMDDIEIRPEDIVKIPTGWAFEIPRGYFGLVVTRSSLGKDGIRIAGCANIVDADFRGEMLAYMRNDGIYPRTIKAGERYAQIVLVPVLMGKLLVVDELTETSRTGGFGSTGK